MCERYSWIERDGEVLFLTPDDVWRTRRGLELQRYTPVEYDWHGHGAIRWYCGLSDGVGADMECTDFRSPYNFPPVLAAAIHRGAMWEFGITRDMEVMLTPGARREYEKVERAALAEHKKVWHTAWEECDKVKRTMGPECKKGRREAARATREAARAKRNEVQQTSLAKYEKAKQTMWTQLWRDPSNRIEVWR